MKKAIMFLSLVMAFILLPLTLMAQDGSGLVLGFDLGSYVETFAVFITTVVVVTDLVNKLIKWEGNKKQYLSWGVATVIGLAAYFLKLGIFVGAWWVIPVYTVSFALSANGFYDLVREILVALGLQKK